MNFYIHDLIISISKSLDCVERDLLGAGTNHGKRVCAVCTLIGRGKGLSDKEICDLAGYSVMHDNALTEYIYSEYYTKNSMDINKNFSLHCTFGERNIRNFPFFHPVEDVILYHHENADGSGPFRQTASTTPDYARWIHIADVLDIDFDLSQMDTTKYNSIKSFLNSKRGSMFLSEDVDLLLNSVSFEQLSSLCNESIDGLIYDIIPTIENSFSPMELINLSTVFARIIDYKSTFTSHHSLGIAQKAYRMAQYYNYDEEKCSCFYIAGALHDIGKLSIDNEILEKPGKLTPEEYKEMQKHVVMTYEILKTIKGFDEINKWASRHHEKLNGKGYPFGYTATDLSHEDRLMACLDIYQALREERPYKPPKTHEATLEIMRKMTDELDQNIVNDIDKVFSSEV